MTFLEMLLGASRRNRSLLCIGLDPDPAHIPAQMRAAPDPVYAFCMAMVEATADLVCAFKPNSSFFEALGTTGLETLRRVIADAPRDIPLILDAKRGDVGPSASAYAHAAFQVLRAHAVTLNPYLGGDALAPFLNYAERGCLLLCKTSNPGSGDLQDLRLADDRPLYLEVARRAQEEWNGNGNVGLVMGATHPRILPAVRAVCPDLPLLVPGVGAQGGDVAQAVCSAVDQHGERAIINASRSILYASKGDDFAEAARSAALQLRDSINSALAESGMGGERLGRHETISHH